MCLCASDPDEVPLCIGVSASILPISDGGAVHCTALSACKVPSTHVHASFFGSCTTLHVPVNEWFQKTDFKIAKF